MEGCSIRDAAIKLQTIFLVPIAGESRAPARPEPAPEFSRAHGPQEKPVSEKAETGEGSVENKPLTFVLRSIDQKHPYLAGRGLTEETIQEFGIGYFSGKGSMVSRVVIPIHNERGELVAYAGRAIDGTEPRYKFPAGFHKGQVIYNLHRAKENPAVLVVEGF